MKTSPESYRPISLLPITAKLAERAIQVQLSKYLEESGQISYNSHAYRKFHSTNTAMLQISDSIFTATDQNLIIILTTIDESSAFDCVQHPNLLRKMKLYNCSDETCDWMESYLSYRTQYVQIGAHQSIMSTVKVGVPQGSVLGPLLYSLYTNEIGEVVKDDLCQDLSHKEDNKMFTENCDLCGSVPFYTDDASMIFSSNSRELNQQKIENNLKRIKEFLNDNKLSLNMPKTKLIEIMIKQKRTRIQGNPPSVTTLDQDRQVKIIKADKSLRILGCNLQDNLSWQAHLSTGEKPLLPIIRQKLGALRHIGKNLPMASRMTLANGMILSRINCLLQVWGGTEKKYISKIQTLLNDTARYITGKPRRTSTINLMTSCNWLYTHELSKYQTMITTWTLTRRNIPLYLKIRMTVDDDYKLTTSQPRIQNTLMSYRWRAISLWNSLDDDLRHNNSLPSFKKQLKKLIIARRSQYQNPNQDTYPDPDPDPDPGTE